MRDKLRAAASYKNSPSQGQVETDKRLALTMLKKIDPAMFKRDDTTFLDPFCGTGTFVALIVHKLLLEKHTKESIANRVYCVDKDEAFCNMTREKIKVNFGIDLKHVYNEDSLKKNYNMKFDVVIGNPPYQADGSSKRWIKWVKFIEYGLDICKGRLVYVTPNSWLGPGEGHELVFNNLVYANLNCSKYFNVGSTFSWYVLDKNVTRNDTATFIKPNGKEIAISNNSAFLSTNADLWSVAKKFFIGDTFNFQRTTEHHTSSRSKWEDVEGEFEVFHTHAQTFRSNVEPRRYSYKGYKVYMTLSGYPTAFVRNNIALSQVGAWMEVSEDEVEGAESVFNSKLYQTILSTHKWSGWNSLDVIKALPRVDLTRKWTDLELFEHFKLSEEEIALVENYCL